MPILSMTDIRKSFAGVPALSGSSLSLERGEIHALLGENGAGKTTLMNILYGIYRKDSGDVRWKDEELDLESPKKALARGIGMVHQHFMLVPTLSAASNIVLGLPSPRTPFLDRKGAAEAVGNLSCRYGLEIDPDSPVERMSVGERQRVEILKLLYRNAELLILDEPTAVLSPTEIDSFFAVLGRLKTEGHSIILITHRIPEVLSIADRLTVLRAGETVAQASVSEVDAEELSRLMIGRPRQDPFRARKAPGPVVPVLEIEGLRASDAAGGVERLSGLDATIGRGEIMGIAGVDGNGQKELAECVMGLERPLRGSIKFKGEDIGRANVAERRRRGMVYISDDRHGDGLILDMDLEENYLLGFLRNPDFVRRGMLQRSNRKASTEKAIREYGIKATGPEAGARLLSGGNQQKLILARELAGTPDLIVAFQPTRGLDLGASEFVHEKLLQQRDRGAAVLLISADLEELLALSDRIAVLYRGSLSEPFDNDDRIDLEAIGRLMTGHAGGGSSCA